MESSPRSGAEPDRPGDGAAPAAAIGALGGDALGRALARFAHEAAVDEAAARRGAAYWLDAQAEGEASLAGVVADLAERGVPVTLGVADATGATPLTGAVVALGRDLVVLGTGAGAVTVALDAVDTVRSSSGASTRGDRALALDASLAGLCAELAAERTPVAVWTRSGDVVRGELVGAGVDIVRIRDVEDRRRASWVALASIVRIRAS